MRFLVGKDKQNNADDHAADDCQRDHAGGQNDAHGNGPEEEGNVQRLLDGSAEADDGQSTHHTEGQHHIAGDCQNHKGGDHGQGNQSDTEAGGIHHTGEGLFIDHEDKKAQTEGKNKGDAHIQQTDAGHILQKAGFEDIIESHSENSFLFQP